MDQFLVGMDQFLVALLAFVAVMAIGGAVFSARAARRKAVKARMMETLGQDRTDFGDESAVTKTVGNLGKMMLPKSPSRDLRFQLTMAGYRGKSAPAVFMGAKMILFIIGLVAFTILLFPLGVHLSIKVFFIVAGAAILFFLPNIVVDIRRRQRSAEVIRFLPEAVDLLEICVSSGMSLDMAWVLVSDEMQQVSQILADEMSLTTLETHLGVSRVDAIRHMSERTGADELGSLVSALVQSERFGTSMADTLRVFAESMRDERSTRAQEAAEKIPIKLLFPMVAFIFPALIIVLAGPAAVQLYKMMQGT